ncbi:MAG TPA: HAMP domain-containing sensor histidine kinase [Candidatus Binataceae bacterium]|nr:HAMP domain-containing sensor histidine kinase [Candidatus Binataceae bacterium]
MNDLPVSVSRSTISNEPESPALAWGKGVRLESLGNLAHELRAPLQVLLGYFDILREDYLDGADARVREIVERMNNNTYDLAQAIDNLMEHALAEAGAAAPKSAEDVTMRSLVAEITPVLEAANAHKRLELSFDLERAPEVIHASRRALRSILLNLALNAIKFTDAGSVVITFRTSRTSAAYEIQVSDTGPGMSQAAFNQALKPFAQLSGGSGRRHRGLGLGLSVTQRNVRALGGQIELTTSAARGTNIVVKFPITAHPRHHLPERRKGRTPRLALPATVPIPPSPGKRVSRGH